MNIETFLKQFHSRQIPSQQVAILCRLAKYNSDLDEIERVTGISKASLSNHVSRMVKMELIVKENVGQRRKFLATAKGMSELNDILGRGRVE